MSDTLPEGVAKNLDEEAPVTTQVDTGPIYRVDASSKIPVAKSHGKLWEARISAAKSARKVHMDGWDECVRYYNNNQLDHRTGEDGRSSNRYFSKRRNNQWSETENIVYANVRAIMPVLYSKNPQAEFSTPNEANKEYVATLESLVNTLAATTMSPGLNLKIHAKQWVQTTEICNLAWMEYGYVMRDQSSIFAQEELQRISQELLDAKNERELRIAEGKLMALEEELDILTPAGPFVKFHKPHDVLNDPDSTMPDFSDAKWRAVLEMYPTDYLNAKYGKREDDGTVVSVYEPTHVLFGGAADETMDRADSFKLFDKDSDAHAYGYNTKSQLSKAYRTECVRIFDKTTRRVYLFACNKYTWPIWVENDPYGLPDFYPIEPLVFNTSPSGAYANSNVMNYLDQQDAINEIHDEYRRARQDIKENILYNARFGRDAIEKWLRGGTGQATAVEVPDGMTLRDGILEKPNMLLKVMPLFDIDRPLSSIDRISGVSDVLRNAQFKTNTTNKAIENYNSSTAMRIDEKIDAIEDAIGRVMYGIAFLCAQFMPVEAVTTLIGQQRAEGWRNYSAQELRTLYTCQVVGGSTQKPTSQAKKTQALDIANLMAKLIEYAPSVTIESILRLLDNTFDELELPKDAFERMMQEVSIAMQRGISTQGGESQDASSQDASASAPNGAIEQIASVVDQLPPQVKVALGQILAQGVPVSEALPEVLGAMQQSSGQLQ